MSKDRLGQINVRINKMGNVCGEAGGKEGGLRNVCKINT